MTKCVYTVYKIINNLNNKSYIGVHKTANLDDNYFGSGRAIKNAISKHGKHNFKKEILFVFESAKEAFEKERELTENFNLSCNYNMRIGGVGGFTRENATKGYQNSLAKMTKEQLTDAGKLGYKASLANLNPADAGKKGGLANKGKPKSEEHKQKLRDVWALKKKMRE